MRSLFVFMLLSATTLRATPEKSLPCPGNAALRYWMAFALMDNPTADSELAKGLERVASGTQPWDDSLAPIVDGNQEALATMHRGTRLPSCDWGLEPEMLAAAPIGHLSRARALARLNVLLGMRLAREGRTADAVDAWLAGARFSRDIASGGPYLSALVAGQALSTHLRAIAKAVTDKKLNSATLSKVVRSVNEMPESGFDWGVAVDTEVEGLSRIIGSAEKADDPAEYLARYFSSIDGKPDHAALALRLGLTESQLTDRDRMRARVRQARALYDELRPQLVTAFRGPYDRSIEAVKALDAHALAQPISALGWPSASQLNKRRGEVARSRNELLTLLRQ
ncbi:MAG TPA: hypothetical protein VN461_23065 [Vicinamibacteria bacterium]|nr:hypothetical protein [Vicinamibacteria bacterium]